MVFDNKLSYPKGGYRTLYLNPLFQSKAALVKEKGLLFIEQPLDFLGKTPVCAAGLSMFEPFYGRFEGG